MKVVGVFRNSLWREGVTCILLVLFGIALLICGMHLQQSLCRLHRWKCLKPPIRFIREFAVLYEMILFGMFCLYMFNVSFVICIAHCVLIQGTVPVLGSFSFVTKYLISLICFFLI